MAKVVLASGLARWVRPAGAVPSTELTLDAGGATVRAVLDRVFADHPVLRGYVVDEHGALRHHVAVFVDGKVVRDKAAQAEPVAPHAEVYIMQALSGG